MNIISIVIWIIVFVLTFFFLSVLVIDPLSMLLSHFLIENLFIVVLWLVLSLIITHCIHGKIMNKLNKLIK